MFGESVDNMKVKMAGNFVSIQDKFV